MKAAALQFPLAHPVAVAIIPGPRSVVELEENFRLISHPIPANFWADLRNRVPSRPKRPRRKKRGQRAW